MLSSTSANPSLFSKGPPGWGLVLVQSHPLPPVLRLRADTESPGLNLQKLTFTSLGLAQAASSVVSALPPETTPGTPAHPPRWKLLPLGASPGSLDLSPPSFPDEPPLTLDLCSHNSHCLEHPLQPPLLWHIPEFPGAQLIPHQGLP